MIKEIFNSEENYSNYLAICLDDKVMIFDKITITNIDNEYIEIDAFTNDVLNLDKIEIIKEDIETQKKVNLLFYPNSQIQSTYFSFMTLNNKIQQYKNICNPSTIIKFYCNCDFDLCYSNVLYNNYKESYNDIASDVLLTDDEKKYISYVLENQNQAHWFNDQNILIENEYKRIQNILNKKNIKSTGDIFDPSVLKIINGPTDPMFELNKIIGLNNLKHEIEKLKYNLEYQNKKQKKGIESEKIGMHMCFYGNPGTGKTTVARIMTGLLYEMGYIKKNRCVEINGLELKGTHIGQTATITKGILDYAKGGVLFIDEAYTLYDENENDFGKEAVNTFLKEMEDNRGDLIIIFAGYQKEMEKLLDTNAGFRSRIKKYFNFDDYSTLELTQIFVNLLKNKHLYITKEALEKVIFLMKNARRHQNFGNGRYVNNLINNIEEFHILNVENNNDYERIDTITIDDIKDLENI